MSAETSRIRRRPAWSGAVAVGIALLVATGCGSGPKADYDPETGARIVQQALGLSGDETRCLQAKLDDNPSFAAALNSNARADQAQREGYTQALRRCLPIDAFATLLSTQLQDAIGAATEEQARCVHDQVLVMTTAEQDRLYLYFSNPDALPDEEIAPTSTKLAAVCKLTGQPSTPGPPSTTDPTGDPTGPTG